VAGFVAGIVLAECIAAYLLLPSQSDVQAWAEEGRQKPTAQSGDEEDTEDTEDYGKPVAEIDLGEFSVAAYQPVSNTTLRIDFHLWGTVLEKDESELNRRMSKNANRLRHQILVTVRSSEVPDLTDPGLGLIKRKVLEKTNRVLGKPLIQNILFSEFSFVEQ